MITPERLAEIKTTTAAYDPDAYIAKRQKEAEACSQKFVARYGNDFNAFFYRPQIADTLRKEVMEIIYPDERSHNCLDNDYWHEVHPFNFPGPFYTGETDSCGTGNPEAPCNVLFNEHCQEFIFRQPASFTELICVMKAAVVEVFDSYSCNGNRHWTYEKCKEWWRQKPELIMQLGTPEIQQINGGSEQLYLESNAETDLRKYCFFLEHQYYPTDENIKLPPL